MKKVIMITGASSGMGKETAKKLIEDGHTVYGVARRTEKMRDLADMGGKPMEMDVTDKEQVNEVVDHIIKVEGRIDVLINNAGYGLYGAVEDVSIEAARRQFEVNLFGLARVTKAVLPHMREQRSGKIINISSMGGKIYMPLGAWYHASKHALEGWSDCLRLELKSFNIDVVIIEPGIIATEFGEVTHQPLLDASGDGPYSELARSMAEATKKSYSEEGKPTPPSVIAELIVKAVNTNRPRTRYVKGKMAKMLISLRKLVSDRMFDKVLLNQVK